MSVQIPCFDVFLIDCYVLEMDSGIVLPICPQGSKAVKNTRMRSPTKQKSFLLNSARTPRAITDGRTPNPAVETEEDTHFARDTMARSQSIYAPSVKAPSAKASILRVPSIKAHSVRGPTIKAPTATVRSINAPSVRDPTIKAPTATARSINAPSIRALSIKAPGVRAPSIRAPSVTARSIKSNNSNTALSIRSNKSGRPKLIRSVTSTTRLGSVTRRAAPSSPRKKIMSRSKTTLMPSHADGKNNIFFPTGSHNNPGTHASEVDTTGSHNNPYLIRMSRKQTQTVRAYVPHYVKIFLF